MHTSEWRMEPGSMPTWAKVLRGSEKDGDLEIVAVAYSIEGCSAEGVANLIAAAPELLAALRGVLHWADCECKRLAEDTPANDDPPMCDYCVAKLVIAKAEGRSE